MTAATELSRAHPRLKVVQKGDSISIEVPLSVFKLLVTPLILAAVAATIHALSGRVSILAFFLPLWLSWPELVHERIELGPEGLRFRDRNGPVWNYKTLNWEPVSSIQPGPGGLRGNAVLFGYDGAPYIGTQFRIGWNLTREESKAVAQLISGYRALHLTA